MIAFWWAFSVISYLVGSVITFRQVLWHMHRYNRREYPALYGGRDISETLSADAPIIGMVALFWPATVPVMLAYKGTRATARATNLSRWIMTEPVPLSERKATRKRERLNKLNEDIKNAERELDKVTSLVQELQQPEHHKYGYPGHRGY
jgi:hypothetical protein